MLEASDIHVRLGAIDVLHGLRVSVDAGERLAIVGPNGSGKSTLVRTLAGVLRPHAGTVRADGQLLSCLSVRRRAAKLGLLTQSADIPGLTTVQEHVGLGRHSQRGWLSRWTPDDAAVVERAMDTCEVRHLALRRMEDLSGGERQRVRLATLLAQNPDVLLLDEPLTGLDIEHQLALLDLLSDLNRKNGKTIVCVLHDLELAMRYFRRVMVLNNGRVAADGAPNEVLCPRLFETVFRVDGRIGCEIGGEPVIMCRRCTRSTASASPQIIVKHTLPRQEKRSVAERNTP